MKSTILIILGFCLCCGLKAQQLTQTTPIQELQHIWNPAFTATGEIMDASVYFRRQWIGFDGSPTTAVASLQYPFSGMNMSAGALLMVDRTDAVRKTGIQLNYAYKLKELLSRDDQLSLGVMTYLHQYVLDPTGLVVVRQDDVQLATMRTTKFVPSFGAGMAYLSNTEEYSGDNIFYFGFSALQLLQQNIFLDQGNAKRERHFFVNMGTKLFGYKNYIEPSFQVNYVNPQLINYVISAKFELEKSFWAGLSLSNINDISINGGVILDGVAGRYSSVRLGALATINGGDIMGAGTTFEFFANYTINVD